MALQHQVISEVLQAELLNSKIAYQFINIDPSTGQAVIELARGCRINKNELHSS